MVLKLQHIQEKQSLVLVFIFSIIATLSCGRSVTHKDIEALENNKTYTIWYVLHKFSDEGESDRLIPDIELIETFPDALKAIVAHYSTFIPSYMWDEATRSAFAAALGNFSTLKEAQQKLLKKYGISKLQTAFYKGTPVSLELKETSDAVFFTCIRGWQNTVTDEFKISGTGTIVYIEGAVPTEPIKYDRELILDRYYKTHTIKLNGEKIDLRYTYLDYGNIESVGINERDKIIYIEQKDKNPQYFSPSEIDISTLSFTVKSIDEVTLLVREDGFGNYSVYDNKRTKIERNAIRMIVNDLISTDGKKYMDIVLLF